MTDETPRNEKIVQIQQDLVKFFNKPHEFKIKILEARQGIGKTKELENYCIRKGKGIIITSAEHKHLDEIEANLKNKGFNNIHHTSGFERVCPIVASYKIKTKDEQNEMKKHEKVIRLLEHEISPSIICDICGKCKTYLSQFYEKVLSENIVLMPLEQMMFLKIPDSVGEIVIEERIDKYDSISYSIRQEDIEDLSNFQWGNLIKEYNDNIEVQNNNSLKKKKRTRIEHEAFMKNIRLVQDYIKKVHDELEDKFSVSKDLETAKRDCIVVKSKKEYRYYHKSIDLSSTSLEYIEQISKLLKIRKMEYYGSEGVIVEDETKFSSDLENLSYFCIENENYSAFEIISIIKEHNKFFDRLFDTPFFTVSWNERMNLNFNRLGMGNIYGENKRALMNYYIPYIHRIFDLHRRGKKITVVCADFNMKLFNIWLEDYKLARSFTTRLFTSKPFKRYFIIENSRVRIGLDFFECKDIPKYKAKLYHATRGRTGSWSESSLDNEIFYNGEKVPAIEKLAEEQIKPLKTIEGKESGIISNKKYIDKYFPDWKSLCFFGSGSEGSNKLADVPLLILLWTPIPPLNQLIKQYFRIFNRYPEVYEELVDEYKDGEKIKVERSTCFPKNVLKIEENSLIGYKDEDLDLIFKIESVSRIVNAVHRSRNLNDENVSILCCCNIPEKVVEQFEKPIEEIKDIEILKTFNPDAYEEKRKDYLKRIVLPKIIKSISNNKNTNTTAIIKDVKINGRVVIEALKLGKKEGILARVHPTTSLEEVLKLGLENLKRKTGVQTVWVIKDSKKSKN